MIRISLYCLMIIGSSIPAYAANNPAFSCGYESPFQSQHYKGFEQAIAPDFRRSDLLKYYTQVWELQEKQRRCEAFTNGQKPDFSCLYGKQDLDAIQQMLPKDFASMSDGQLRQLKASLTSKQVRFKQINVTHNICVKAGVWRGKIRKVE